VTLTTIIHIQNDLLRTNCSKVLVGRLYSWDFAVRLDNRPDLATDSFEVLSLPTTCTEGRIGELRQLEGDADPNLSGNQFLQLDESSGGQQSFNQATLCRDGSICVHVRKEEFLRFLGDNDRKYLGRNISEQI
jgi:hypothetical protein